MWRLTTVEFKVSPAEIGERKRGGGKDMQLWMSVGNKRAELQPYTTSYSQLRKAGSRGGDPPQERVYQLVVQCQTASPENIYR